MSHELTIIFRYLDDEYKTIKVSLKVVLGISLLCAIFATPANQPSALGLGILGAMLLVNVINGILIDREELLLGTHWNRDDDVHAAMLEFPSTVRFGGGVIILAAFIDALAGFHSWYMGVLAFIVALVTLFAREGLIHGPTEPHPRPAWWPFLLSLALVGGTVWETLFTSNAFHWSRTAVFVTLAVLFFVYAVSNDSLQREKQSLRGIPTTSVYGLSAIAIATLVIIDATSGT